MLTSKDWHLHKDVMLTISCSDLRVKLWSYVSYLCLFHLPLILSLARSLSLSPFLCLSPPHCSLLLSDQMQYLRASSEEEIFAHLGLEYIPPCDRNA